MPSRRRSGSGQGSDIARLERAGYPPPLAAIIDPPPGASGHAGRWQRFERPAVAIVGSRAASPYALEVAGRLAADVAARGFSVVSGLARGVDSAAHRGALSVGGVTIAVLGSAADVIYPLSTVHWRRTFRRMASS